MQPVPTRWAPHPCHRPREAAGSRFRVTAEVAHSMQMLRIRTSLTRNRRLACALGTSRQRTDVPAPPRRELARRSVVYLLRRAPLPSAHWLQVLAIGGLMRDAHESTDPTLPTLPAPLPSPP